MDNWKITQEHINSVYSKYNHDINYLQKNPCGVSLKDLQNHQKFLAKYTQDVAKYSNAGGLLIFHGMGSGKTCSSIAIAEGLKAMTVDKE